MWSRSCTTRRCSRLCLLSLSKTIVDILYGRLGYIQTQPDQSKSNLRIYDPHQSNYKQFLVQSSFFLHLSSLYKFISSLYVQCHKWFFNGAHANSISCHDVTYLFPFLLITLSLGHISLRIKNNGFKIVFSFGFRIFWFGNNRLGLCCWQWWVWHSSPLLVLYTTPNVS